MESTSYTATIAGGNGDRIHLVLMRDEAAPEHGSGLYRWHERDTDADCEVSGMTIRQAVTAAEAAWPGSWDFQLNRTKPANQARLGRPPKPAADKARRTNIALTPADYARLDAVPGKSRSDRIRHLIEFFEQHAALR
jgi:hypothetical protein